MQYIDMAKYNIVPALLSVYGNTLTVSSTAGAGVL